MARITKTQLQKAYKKAENIHQKHLQDKGVELPRWGSARAYQLAILIHHSPSWIHKDKISDIVRRFLPKMARDQQVRHLYRCGWNLESDGEGNHRLAKPRQPHPSHRRQRIRRQNLLSAKDFNDIKKGYAYKCATCGAQEGKPDPRYLTEPVKLHKAHKDPAKELDKNNVIPQCQFCNRAYLDDFTFDDHGRVRAVASPKPVLRASREVRKKVAVALRKKDGK